MSFLGTDVHVTKTCRANFPGKANKKYENWREYVSSCLVYLKAWCKDCKSLGCLQSASILRFEPSITVDERWACDETSAPVQHVHIHLYQCYGSVVVSMRIRIQGFYGQNSLRNIRKNWISIMQNKLLSFQVNLDIDSVADQDPGSGAFLTPGYRIRDPE